MISSQWYAHCDADGCLIGNQAALEAKSEQELLDDMRADGWTTRGNKHYCGECSKEMRHAT